MPRIQPHRAEIAKGLHERVAALGLGAPVAIRVSPRARRILLRVDATGGGIELVLPRAGSAEAGLKFLAAQRGWVAARLRALPPPVPFVEDAVIPVWGRPHRIRRESSSAEAPVAIVDGEIRVRGDPLHLGRRVRDHLIALARRELSARARELAEGLGQRVERVAVRDTRSRWGSCSAKGSLSFSWRLVFAPDAVADYVVAHEVAHLIEMNHGPRFWRLVATLVGDSQAPRAWLRRHRLVLMSYGG